MAVGCIGDTTPFASVVGKPNNSFVVSSSFNFRTEVQQVQMPAKNANGRLSSCANHTGTAGLPARFSYSEKLVIGKKHLCSIPSHGRQ